MATRKPTLNEFKWENEKTLLHVPTDTHFNIIGTGYSYEELRVGRKLDNGDEYWPSDVVAMAEEIMRKKQKKAS